MKSACEIARIGYIGTSHEVFIYTDDDCYIPHVHIRDMETKGRLFEACVSLIKNEYVGHNGRHDVMTDSMAKAFASFMKAPSRNKRYGSNYEYAIDMWNDNNEEACISCNNAVKMAIPNYNILKTTKNGECANKSI